MKILVDADACPVKEIIEKVAKQKNIEVVMYIDSSHILSSDYSKIVTSLLHRITALRRLHSDAVRMQSVTADLFMITIISINLCLKGFWDRKYAEPAEKAVRRLTRKRELKKMTNGLNEIF